MKLLGENKDLLKSYFNEGGSNVGGDKNTEGGEKPKATIKGTFKIEINEEEKKMRDKQQTTLYHTGAQKKGQQALIELDEEDRREIEKEALAEVDEQEHEDDDEENEEDDEVEDDPDEDLDF